MTTTQNTNTKGKIIEEYCEDCGHVYDTCVNDRGECTNWDAIQQAEYWD